MPEAIEQEAVERLRQLAAMNDEAARDGDDAPHRACARRAADLRALLADRQRLSDELAAARRPKCSCMEVYGEDPNCIKHGSGTEWAKANPDVVDLVDRLRTAEASLARMREALRWYGEQVADCRKISPPGEKARNALDADGGNRARAALAAPASEKPGDGGADTNDMILVPRGMLAAAAYCARKHAGSESETYKAISSAALAPASPQPAMRVPTREEVARTIDHEAEWSRKHSSAMDERWHFALGRADAILALLSNDRAETGGEMQGAP